MRLVEHFINNPVKVAACVILLVLFGLLTVTPPSIMPSPLRVAVQMTPNLDEPVVSVQTTWEGASPEEVEREIVDKQEEMLKGLQNLRKMTSAAIQGQASIEMEFVVGTDQDVAKQDVSDALRRVQYQIPQNEFDNPTVQSGRPHGEEAIAWMILTSDRPEVHVPSLHTFVDEKVKPMLERVEGVSAIRIFGGREREIQVVVDPLRLAQAAITFAELQTALQSQNTNVSAGNSAQGKRDVLIRTMGQFASLDDIRKTVVKVTSGGPIRVEDVADVVDTFKKQYDFVRSEGQEVIALPAYRKSGSNVIEVMEGLRAAIAQVNAEVLEPRGMKLELTQVYDETVYISSAIALVRDNIFYGGILAAAVLIVFLRSLRATGVVAVAIPISVVGTFLVIPLAGRNVNVVMLAGLAFAVGMVVDNAIVVLENIYRHREMGKSRREAAADGASEVWGAVVANSLTTMVVFLPIIFVKEEAGQLFRDIAIAISGAVGLSMVVSVTVIPPLAARILAGKARSAGAGSRSAEGAGGSSGEDAGRLAAALAWLVRGINRHVLTRLLVVGLFTTASVEVSRRIAPEPSYLPSGNQNLIFGFLITPPGYSPLEFNRIAYILENGDPSKGRVALRRFWEVDTGTPEYDALIKDWFAFVDAQIMPGLQAQLQSARNEAKNPSLDDKARRKARAKTREAERQIAEWRVPPPPIDNFFFVAYGGGCFMGCSSKDPEVVRPLEKVLGSTGLGVPDAWAIFFQKSIFTSLGSSNSVDIELRGDDLDQVYQAGQVVMMECAQRFGSFPETNPSNFTQRRREDRIVPDRIRAGDVGLTVAEIGSIVRACGDGRIVGQYREAGRSIDLAVRVAGTEDRAGGRSETAMIAQVPIYTPVGQRIPLGSVCRIDATTAPQQISHIETQRSVKLSIRPPEGMSLPDTIRTIQEDIIAPMRAGGFGPMKYQLPPDIIVSLAGNADKLRTTWDSMKWLLGLSLLIVYLLMAGLFESWIYPFVIIFTVPFAVVGGFLGLRLVNEWTWRDPTLAIQQLDMLTILGFVILLGIVVNNGILIVHQSLNFLGYGLAPQDAIVHSVRTRLRPIMMTVLTTLFGQIPLVVRPGAGAELYRGLGAVVLGGLLMSTLLTLIVVPAVLSLFFGARVTLGRLLYGSGRATTRAAEPTVTPASSGHPGVAPRERDGRRDENVLESETNARAGTLVPVPDDEDDESQDARF